MAGVTTDVDCSFCLGKTPAVLPRPAAPECDVCCGLRLLFGTMARLVFVSAFPSPPLGSLPRGYEIAVREARAMVYEVARLTSGQMAWYRYRQEAKPKAVRLVLRQLETKLSPGLLEWDQRKVAMYQRRIVALTKLVWRLREQRAEERRRARCAYVITVRRLPTTIAAIPDGTENLAQEMYRTMAAAIETDLRGKVDESLVRRVATDPT